jgi:hypothetical protein
MAPSYETLDTIADAYAPLLLIVSLAFIVVALFRARWRAAGLLLLTVSAVLAIAYGIRFFDSRFNIWSTFGLDYSTHTAVALVLVASLTANMPRLAVLWVGSLIVYALLMLYQGYHTVPDIAATAAVVIVPTWLVVARLYDHRPFRTAHNSLDRTRKNSAPVS